MKAILAIQDGSEIMHLHADGAVSRPAIKMLPSGQWMITGAREYNNFGGCNRRYTLADILNRGETIPWKFQNGKQRTFITDLDHGTAREWRSPGHGVAYRLAP